MHASKQLINMDHTYCEMKSRACQGCHSIMGIFICSQNFIRSLLVLLLHMLACYSKCSTRVILLRRWVDQESTFVPSFFCYSLQWWKSALGKKRWSRMHWNYFSFFFFLPVLNVILSHPPPVWRENNYILIIYLLW